MNMDYKEFIKDKKFKHFYIYKDVKGKPEKKGVVLLTEDGNFGYSFCNELDNFSKSEGKAIAYMRAQSGKTDFNKVPEEYAVQALGKVVRLAKG